jgi:hypothetical protein
VWYACKEKLITSMLTKNKLLFFHFGYYVNEDKVVNRLTLKNSLRLAWSCGQPLLRNQPYRLDSNLVLNTVTIIHNLNHLADITFRSKWRVIFHPILNHNPRVIGPVKICPLESTNRSHKSLLSAPVMRLAFFQYM